MAHVVILGAGIGGLSAAYEMKQSLDKVGGGHSVTVVSNTENFHFVPSNPWVAVGWRDREAISIPLRPHLERKGINVETSGAQTLHPERNAMTLGDGKEITYDYLLITTGPRLAFELVEGLGPDGHTQSVCHVDHAHDARHVFEEFCKDPGPIVVGAAPGASCFGPAYEFAFILDAELRKRKIRDKVPMHFVTPEPYIGHLGLGGVGDSKGMLESELRQHHIKWDTNAKITKVEENTIHFSVHNAKGEVEEEKSLPFKYSMIIPAFRGVPAVAAVEGLCNPLGFVLINKFQQSPKFANIYSAGVCVAIPPVEATPVPTGAPKTGYMIESMVTAAIHNIIHQIKGEEPEVSGSWDAICLADMGDTGIAFVAQPQIPPRNTQWMKKGKWVHVAKIGFEKYFLKKMKSGSPEPFYEKWVLEALGIKRLK
jgi:sulfide:quinone oxidoreductase